MMASPVASEHPMLRCGDCNYTWNARKTAVSQPRRCPECGSRSVSLAQSEVPKEETKVGTAVPTDGIDDDPEVKAKLKELRLVQIEAQIALETLKNGEPMEKRLIELEARIDDLVGWRDCYELAIWRSQLCHWITAKYLRKGFGDSRALDYIESVCPLCGAYGENGLEMIDENNSNKRRCNNCGGRIS